MARLDRLGGVSDLRPGAASLRRCRWASCSDNRSIENVEASGPHRGELDTALAGRADRASGDRAADLLCRRRAAAQRGRHRQAGPFASSMGMYQPPCAPGDTRLAVSRSTRTPHRRTMLDQEPAMARPAFVVNEALREKVWHLAGLGVPQDDIAKIVGCAPKTLRKRFRDELDRGVAEANAIISGCLFAAAKGGNTTAQIFWMKTRGGWRERQPADDRDADADAGSGSEVLVLPDNNRDPELTQVLQDAREK